MLERLDGALRLGEDVGGLRQAVALNKSQVQDDLLLLGEFTDPIRQVAVGVSRQRLALCFGVAIGQRIQQRFDRARLAAAVMIDQTIMGDAEKPGGEAHAPVFKARQHLDHPQEDVGSDVFGGVRIAHPVVHVAVDGRYIDLVELRNSISITALRAMDKRLLVSYLKWH